MKKILVFVAVFAILFSFVACFSGQGAVESVSPRVSMTIILDAGHGGIDVGAVGKNGTLESDLNLDYCLTLKNMFEDYGVNVVLTRQDKNGLYREFKSGFKMEDMRKRREIIQTTRHDLLISIHMNKFSASSSRGAQVYYDEEKQVGKELAENLQRIFQKQLPFARKETQSADLYVLKSTNAPSILIECGFLSNPQEEKMLLEKEHKQNLCYCIVASVLATINV